MLCLQCMEPAALTITAERDGYLYHYATCWQHVDLVVRRLRAECEPRRPFADLAERSRMARAVGTIDTTESSPALASGEADAGT